MWKVECGAVPLPRLCGSLRVEARLRYPRNMATTLEKVIEEAMTLPNESRAELADPLVQSLETGGLGSIDRLWITEAKRRRDEMRAGLVDTIPGEAALRKVRDLAR
jgi:hypothetical protein